jgi:hypothetical protein
MSGTARKVGVDPVRESLSRARAGAPLTDEDVRSGDVIVVTEYTPTPTAAAAVLSRLESAEAVGARFDQAVPRPAMLIRV